MVSLPLALIGPIGWVEAIIIGMVGLLIFGRRLPEVGKGLGKSIVEFKKGLAGIEDDLSTDSPASGKRSSSTVVERQKPAIESSEAVSSEPLGQTHSEKTPA